MSALEINQLSCFYEKNEVLKALDLNLANNEIICLLGESGCGKTTLLKAVAGLQENLQGEIFINGNVVNNKEIKRAPEKRKVGFIFQDYALFPHLNIFDNVAFSLYSLDEEEKKARVLSVLKLVQLEPYAMRFPHQLSGGQQQRVAIARALAYQPDLMLLDEPFSNLDYHVRFKLIHEIRALLKSAKMSALFVTHSKEEGFAFADKIALMQAGKIVQIGTAQNLYQRPQSKYVADFMGESNYLTVSVKDRLHYQSELGLLSSTHENDFKIGDKLTLLLRPEQLMIEADINGVATIKQIHFAGAYLQLTVTYLGHDYIVKQSSHQHHTVGDKVTLTVLPHPFVFIDCAK